MKCKMLIHYVVCGIEDESPDDHTHGNLMTPTTSSELTETKITLFKRLVARKHEVATTKVTICNIIPLTIREEL